MDAPIALALMAKAKKVFERDGASLSFPLTPKLFKKEQLNFLTGTPTNRALLDLSEFSRLVNLIPGGTIWDPQEERYLWNAYSDILDGYACASSTRTPGEEAQYQRALQYLYKDRETRAPSPALLAYWQYRDAWLRALEKFNNRLSEAESSNQPEVKLRWHSAEEPALREQIHQREDEWRVKGFREQVEKAREEERILSSKSPSQTIGEWAARFIPAIDSKTDTNTLQFYLSGYSPSNAFENGAWQRFTLSGEEATTLLRQAPAELRSRLAPNPVNLDIESLSIEYSYVNITRPWLATDVFNARFWKFRENGKLLSDGKTPPGGICPAYVSALIFARKLEIKLKPNSNKNDAAAERLQNDKYLSLGFIPFAVREGQLITNPYMPPNVSPRQSPIREQANVTGLQTSLNSLQQSAITRIPLKPELGVQIGTVKPGTGFQTLPLRYGLPPLGPTLPRMSFSFGMDPNASASNDNDLYVMAFVCKQLPRCPDPDPALQWS